MVRFSCFSTNLHSHRSKKEVQRSSEAMSKASEDYSHNQWMKVSSDHSSLAPMLFKETYDKSSSANVTQDTNSSLEHCRESGEMHSDSSQEISVEVHQKTGLTKSQSLGSTLDRGGRVSDSEDEFDPKQLLEGEGDLANRSPREYGGDSGHHSPDIPPTLAKSCSVPDFGLFSPVSKDGPSSHVQTVHRCRSEELNVLDERDKCEDPSGERYEDESYNNHAGESSLQNLSALHNKDFKIRRIEEWVSMIDLGESNSLQKTIESPHSFDTVNKGSYVSGSASTAKMDSKSTHGMEAAKKYVSTLRATSTTAQLANFGLAVVPFLSAFVSLKTLNLSGNAIVRITSGALPRGLHVLNLAKNNISTIEGLRELTRLRVLDLSYNRILRIGHGLASCSSLKELYLAGNKISEVEGLHRLLKLNVLDLRFNKITTAKCLGQLAANYSSLQAINLEGNPAQRNVGDEHLKKYLQGILPNLVYFNKQTIRASSSKEAVDRSSRSAIASQALDRGSRSEHKLVRKGSLTVGKTSSSSHGHRVPPVSSSKQSKDRHGRLPPIGTTRGSHRHNYLDFGTKLMELRSNLTLRRTRSEGNLGES